VADAGVAAVVEAPAPGAAADAVADAVDAPIVLKHLLTKILTAYDTEKNKFMQARGSGAGMQTSEKDKQFQISYDKFHYVYARMMQTKDFNVMFANLFRMYLTEKPIK
jgi:IMP cyclohydrolase